MTIARRPAHAAVAVLSVLVGVSSLMQFRRRRRAALAAPVLAGVGVAVSCSPSDQQWPGSFVLGSRAMQWPALREVLSARPRLATGSQVPADQMHTQAARA